jgi:cupin superfamily acireductone dioxygenase involved in methionine salvage
MKMHDIFCFRVSLSKVALFFTRYPVKSVPWDPSDAVDPELAALRDARGYSYADIITVHPDHLPDFDAKVAQFRRIQNIFLNQNKPEGESLL